MDQPKIKIVLVSIVLLAAAIWLFLPNTDEQIMAKLKSNKPTQMIEGAREAADEHNDIFVPQLLKNAHYSWASTNPHYKGITVYSESMFALEHTLHIKPPHRYFNILVPPDPVNIKFFTVYWSLRQKRLKG